MKLVTNESRPIWFIVTLFIGFITAMIAIKYAKGHPEFAESVFGIITTLFCTASIFGSFGFILGGDPEEGPY